MASTKTPELIRIEFWTEELWRSGIDWIVDTYPNVYLEPAGDFGLIVPKSLKPWVEDKFHARYSKIIDLDGFSGESAAAGVETNEPGIGLSPEFDNPEWLAERSAQLRKENDQLRASRR